MGRDHRRRRGPATGRLHTERIRRHGVPGGVVVDRAHPGSDRPTRPGTCRRRSRTPSGSDTTPTRSPPSQERSSAPFGAHQRSPMSGKKRCTVGPATQPATSYGSHSPLHQPLPRSPDHDSTRTDTNHPQEATQWAFDTRAALPPTDDASSPITEPASPSPPPTPSTIETGIGER